MSTSAPAPSASKASAAQPFLVRRAAVLGAGTMGSRIAAHLANAGIPTLLLDMVPAGDGERSRLATGALGALAKAKPAALYESSRPRSSPPATSTTTSKKSPAAIG